MGNFLKVAIDELFTYRTPKKVVDFMVRDKIKSIIGNPKYGTKTLQTKRLFPKWKQS